MERKLDAEKSQHDEKEFEIVQEVRVENAKRDNDGGEIVQCGQYWVLPEPIRV